ncbi:hypothetical protein F4823DRAFT_583758 [Ustulina deusta]|nr:hypothetical protein F4823DRAFT_583758 [Ustulina deusta]
MKDIKNWNKSDKSDDYDKSLQQITARYGKPFISLLLDIQEEPQVQQHKFFRFIRRLECFPLDRKQLQLQYPVVSTNETSCPDHFFHCFLVLRLV